MNDKIEILSTELFDTLKDEMSVVERIQQYFKGGIGWHYYLDLAWMVKEMSALPIGSVILDAGAGTGLSQFILLELGYNVISVDFANRALSKERLTRYGRVIHYINDQSEKFVNQYTEHLEKTYNIAIDGKASGASTIGFDVAGEVGRLGLKRGERRKIERAEILKDNVEDYCGRLFIYKADLKQMDMIPSGFVDGVISISALEHNTHDDFRVCMNEILRVTKPGGRLAVTISASQGDDWFHAPSKGWCYSDKTLREFFGLAPDAPSNYADKERLFELLKAQDNELHKRLAQFYYQSGDNGMPWGKWDPQYQPVGVVKIKKEEEAR